jgi:uncharacterized radical SAM protein YgiQ
MKQHDIIFVSAEPYVDHPFSAVGILKRVLEDKGFSVGVIEHPNWKKDEDFLRLGKPNLFFAVSSGSMDSMLVNYTPMKKKRQESKFSKISYKMPDRAVIVYCNMIRKLFKNSRIVIGGIESSLRRFAHYDYWDNDVRKSILLDSRADILVYGYGELQIIEIAKRIKEGREIKGVEGTCIVSKEVPEYFEELPSFGSVLKNKKEFCNMHNKLCANKNLAQKFDSRYVLQYKSMQYTQQDLDYIYSLDYSRKTPSDYPEFSIVEFSVLTHRGCFGNCNFCSINANTGRQVISRSINSILDEIKKIAKLPDFKGRIELSGATANMYGMDCDKSLFCRENCIICKKTAGHKKIISLLREARSVPGVKKVVIKSGVRYDLALKSQDYIRDLVKYHIDHTLMIAPEHIDKKVQRLMNKESDVDKFIRLFRKISKEENKQHELSFYILVGHPGCSIENSKELSRFIKKYRNTNFVQIFTPTPMTASTCMYYTGIDPKSMKKVYVPYTYNEKKRQKNIALGVKSNSKANIVIL